MNTRISLRLPVMIAALLAAVIATFGALAYNEMRHSAEAQASDRVRTASSQIALLLTPGADARLRDVATVRRDTALVAALYEPNERTLDAARARLERLQRASQLHDAIELWDTKGNLLLDIPAPESLSVKGAPRVAPRLADADTLVLGDIESHSEYTWFDVTTTVRDGSRQLGYVVKRRRIMASPQATRTVEVINDLIGVDARFLLGQPQSGWTDLLGPAEGPQQQVRSDGSMHTYRLATGERRIGAAQPIENTPWYAWVEFPYDRVYRRSFDFLVNISMIGLAVALIGAFAGWRLSRPITKPLGILTQAATRMASGDYAHRVELDRKDELGQLAAAFDRMATAVQDARDDLERKVERRTSELKETLSRLSASEQQFRSLASSAGAAIITADEQGRIIYVNPAGESMFGYGPGDLLGKPIAVLMPHDDREEFDRRQGRLLEGSDSGSNDRTMEATARRRDGSTFPVDVSLATWVVDGRRSIGAVIRDISERRAMQASLEERARRLESANKELAAFSYSVSHDLRAPLRGLQGFSEALLEDYGEKLDERGLNYLHRVSEAAGRMGRLIDELLELSRVSRTELRRETVQLLPLVRMQVSELQRLEPDRKVALVAHEVPPAVGDERLISLVLQNLIENAWKFTRGRPDARIEFGANGERDGHPVYFIRDNGAGFEMQYADKLFGVFQRLHAETDFPGTGVGLAIVHRIILRHGGEVWAEAAPEEGATFFFTLGGRNPSEGIEA